MPQPSTLPPNFSAADSLDARRFACTSRTRGVDAVWVHAAGELDLIGAPRLAEALREALRKARVVALDLRDVSFMDTAGVHVIVDCASEARHDGRRLLLVRAPSQVQRMFELTGTAERITAFDLNPAEPPVQVLLQDSRQTTSTA